MLLTPRAALAKDALAMRAAVERPVKESGDFPKQRLSSRVIVWPRESWLNGPTNP